MSYAAWFDHFTRPIGSEEIVHAVHQRRRQTRLITLRESLTGHVTEVIVVARLAAMCGFIMLGCPNSNKKKFIFVTLTTLFSKKY